MIGKRKKIKSVILIFLILAMPVAYAGTWTEAISELVIGPIWRAMYLTKVWFWITNKATLFAKHVDTLILFNPSPANNPMISNLMGSVIKMVLPLYILAILINAFYLIFFSGSPGGRTNAKQAILRIFISMILFSLSPLLLTLLLQFSESLTKAAFGITGVEPITEMLEGGIYGAYAVISWTTMATWMGASPWSYSLYFIAWFSYIFVGIRYIVLTVLEIIFPLTVFMYSFNFTRGVGRGLMEATVAWILLQFFWALVLVALVLSASSLREVFVENPTIGGVNFPVLSAIPGVDWLINQLFGGFGIGMAQLPGFQTDIFTLILGIVGYGMICALPFGLVLLMRGYLP